MDDADALHAELAYWVGIYAELGRLSGPPLAGSLVLPSSKRRIPDTHLLACRNEACPGCFVIYDASRVAGLRAGGDHEASARLAAWILGHFEGFAAQRSAGSWHDRITALYGQISGRWPLEDRVRKLPIPCRRCDRVMLFMHPPISGPIVERETDGEGRVRDRVVYAADHTVCCHARDCGDVMTEADYYLRAQALLAERRTARR